MKLADGIHTVSQVKGGHVHAFLLDGGGSLTLIDSLYGTDAGLLLAEIASARSRSSRPRATHRAACLSPGRKRKRCSSAT